MIAIVLELFFGVTLGLVVAPLWTALQIPMRVSDALNAGSMRLCAVALALAAMLGALSPRLGLPETVAVIAMLAGGAFVGMVSAALVEAVEVVPTLYDRLSVTADMRWVAAALMIGKTGGALYASLRGG